MQSNFFINLTSLMSDEGTSTINFSVTQKNGKLTVSLIPVNGVHIENVSLKFDNAQEADNEFFKLVNEPLQKENQEKISVKLKEVKKAAETKGKKTESKDADHNENDPDDCEESCDIPAPAPAKAKGKTKEFDPKKKLGEQMDLQTWNKITKGFEVISTKHEVDGFNRNVHQVDKYYFAEIVGFYKLINDGNSILSEYEFIFKPIATETKVEPTLVEVPLAEAPAAIQEAVKATKMEDKVIIAKPAPTITEAVVVEDKGYPNDWDIAPAVVVEQKVVTIDNVDVNDALTMEQWVELKTKYPDGIKQNTMNILGTVYTGIQVTIGVRDLFFVKENDKIVCKSVN